ncbi:uncharacterized protein TrAFT101_011003 [Trichoderma asperellum]|uniref:uncharacterized protein n=1 Tax=Trichoderma asperellum TaxID=101201 RepID=UPI0033338510|nr:hypothetical protein TrAFT101_011003 [Trichoderma asperellum]
MKLLEGQYEGQIHVTEKILMAAARNDSSGEAIMELLLGQHSDKILTTEEMMKTQR